MLIFLSLDKGVELFNLLEIVLTIERILSLRLKTNYVILEKDIDKKLYLKGKRNEFSQVILNLINNSLDEFEFSKKTSNNEIRIETIDNDNFYIIKIKDNVGGIPKKYLKNGF